MNDLKRRMKMMEERQHAKDIIKQFDAIIVKLDNGIDKCREKAKECLIERNDMNGFRMFGRSMKYYGNMKSSIEAIKCQFENYLIQVEVADSFVGLKDVIGKTAKMMDTMPSLQKNNKDFMKFKKSLMKGQLSMESINSMMSNLDPSSDAEMSNAELESLKEEILMTSGAAQSKVASPKADKATQKSPSDNSFFDELDL
ncbi:MAG: hypothetical protein J6A47_05485 [Bacilli bacterium]|nr:hypothetical protein [Bacilli bacterium]MBO6286807.1 hypothetical protein [Bacilli bacterium]